MRDDLAQFHHPGAAKAGTTALYHYLGQHPQICMSRTKETNFLALKDDPLDFRGPGDRDFISRFSVTTLDGYREQFRGCEAKPAIGEASPLYLYSPRAVGLIGEVVPDAKLIAILRNPIDRAYSAFLHLVRDGRETVLDFGEALRLEDERIRDGWEHIWHYRRMGYYFAQLNRYYQLFDPSRIKVYLYHDFKSDPLAVLRDLFRFLGVDESFTPDVSTQHNDARLVPELRPPLLPGVRLELQAEFREDILKLERLLDRDLSRWLPDMPRDVPSAATA